MAGVKEYIIGFTIIGMLVLLAVIGFVPADSFGGVGAIALLVFMGTLVIINNAAWWFKIAEVGGDRSAGSGAVTR